MWCVFRKQSNSESRLFYNTQKTRNFPFCLRYKGQIVKSSFCVLFFSSKFIENRVWFISNSVKTDQKQFDKRKNSSLNMWVLFLYCSSFVFPFHPVTALYACTFVFIRYRYFNNTSFASSADQLITEEYLHVHLWTF